MHGLDLQRRVKQDFPRLPVILITGNYDEGLESRAIAAGAFMLFYKPFDADALVRTVRAAIEESSAAGDGRGFTGKRVWCKSWSCKREMGSPQYSRAPHSRLFESQT